MLMSLRRAAVAAVAWAGIALAGCQTAPTSHSGFYFGYNKPATVDMPMIVAQGSPSTGLVGHNSYGTQPMQYIAPPASPTLILPPQSQPQWPSAALLRYSESRTSNDCLTLEDACARIKALEASRPTSLVRPQAEALPMPNVRVTPAPAMPPASSDCK